MRALEPGSHPLSIRAAWRPPHFHAAYGEYQAQIVITTLEPLAGDLPMRALRLVREWGSLHRAELEANWEKARSREPLDTIAPLP